MKTLALTVDDLVGTFRTFGEFGPLYKVVKKIGESKVHIVVVPTGEELDYLVERALTDPEAD